jgi:hypothetical protein
MLGQPLLAPPETAFERRYASRVQQIVDWLGRDFHGVIVFDESHAMQNAAGAKGERGEQAPSQQGRAGLRLQYALPDARVLYVSATGGTTVHNLAYAQRLGLWGGADFPFATRAEFVEAIEAGGVAAMEVLARDLKALGLCRHLRWSNSQGREARRSAHPTTHQIRACHQPQDRQGAQARNSPDTARPSRRSDRVAAQRNGGFGSKGAVPLTSSARQIYHSKRTRRAGGRLFRVGPEAAFPHYVGSATAATQVAAALLRRARASGGTLVCPE